MTSFLGMEVEQDEKSIKLHLETYVQEIFEEYKSTIKKFVKPKQVPMQPGRMGLPADGPDAGRQLQTGKD